MRKIVDDPEKAIHHTRTLYDEYSRSGKDADVQVLLQRAFSAGFKYGLECVGGVEYQAFEDYMQDSP